MLIRAKDADHDMPMALGRVIDWRGLGSAFAREELGNLGRSGDQAIRRCTAASWTYAIGLRDRVQ